MSGVYVPPPPPQPPTPPQAAPAGYDFLRPFTFAFDDPRWLPKVLMGGLFMLLSYIVIGVPFLLGYMARLIRNVIAGDPRPLPEWNDLGEFFGEGLILFCVGLIYFLPVSILSVMVGFGSALVDNSDQAAVRGVGGGVFGCASCVLSFISLLIYFFNPAALLMVITTRRFGAAFEFARIWSFISANIGNYLLAIVISVIAWIVSFVGLAGFCVGIFFTQFWSAAVAAFALAQVYRNAPAQP